MEITFILNKMSDQVIKKVMGNFKVGFEKNKMTWHTTWHATWKLIDVASNNTNVACHVSIRATIECILCLFQ